MTNRVPAFVDSVIGASVGAPQYNAGNVGDLFHATTSIPSKVSVLTASLSKLMSWSA